MGEWPWDSLYQGVGLGFNVGGGGHARPVAGFDNSGNGHAMIFYQKAISSVNTQMFGRAACAWGDAIPGNAWNTASFFWTSTILLCFLCVSTSIFSLRLNQYFELSVSLVRDLLAPGVRRCNLHGRTDSFHSGIRQDVQKFIVEPNLPAGVL